MMTGADRAGRMHEDLLRRALHPAPPQKRKRRPARAAPSSEYSSYIDVDTTSHRAAQRAIAHAAKRVGRIEHHVRILRAIGQRTAALRLGAIAEAIREQVLR